MKIGIIGSGNIGGTLGTLWAKAGHQVKFSSRNPERLAPVVQRAGANGRGGSVEEALAFGDILLLAIPYSQTDAVLPALTSLTGKILIDARNPYHPDGAVQRFEGEQTATLRLAEQVPAMPVVKSFNTIYWKVFAEQNHLPEGQRIAIPLAGDDLEAKKTVAGLIEEAGFTLLDVGGLSSPGALAMEPGEPLYEKALLLPELRAIVETL